MERPDLEIMQDAAIASMRYSERPNITLMFFAFVGNIALDENRHRRQKLQPIYPYEGQLDLPEVQEEV
jgi:hypothetical protein